MRRVLSLIALIALAIGSLSSASAPAATVQPYNSYTGGLHTHTAYSDGTPGTTADDLYARSKTEGLAFHAVTEHSEAFDAPITASESCLPTTGGDITKCLLADPKTPDNSASKWEAQRRMAALNSEPGSFAGLRGFEWTSDVHNHVNVYFSRNYTTRAAGGEASLDAFYHWLRTPPLAGGGSDGLATFNHPSDKKLVDQDPRRDWNNLAYVPDLDDRIVGMEIYNGRETGSKNGSPDSPYFQALVKALNNGWHLGVVGAEDIHATDWGAPSYARTTFLAEELTPASLKEAMKARRMYASIDPRVTVDVSGNGKPMGSRVHTDGPLRLEAAMTGGGVTKLEIITRDGTTVVDGNQALVDLPASYDNENWVIVRGWDPVKKKFVAYSSTIWFTSFPEARTFSPRWVAGDLHVHTTWSHDVYGGVHDSDTGHSSDTDPDEAYTLGWTPGEQASIAESRGLDYLALTDHNNTYSVYDPGATSESLTFVPAYESSFAGHAQIVGATSCYQPNKTAAIDRCSSFANSNDAATMRTLANEVRADGGLFQINHPSDAKWLALFGDGAGTPDGQPAIVPDSVEVWNIGTFLYQHPLPASSDNDYSIRYWETFLNAGHHVAATGGSDNHWRSTSLAQGVGQPTTWVWVTKPGQAGIIEGIRAGRTTISTNPPAMGGPRVELTVDSDGDGEFEAVIGDTTGTLSPTAKLRAFSADALPAGSRWRILTDSTGSDGVEVDALSGRELVAPIPPGTTKWVRVELRRPDVQSERRANCEPLVTGPVASNPLYKDRPTECTNRLIVEAMTSPVYVQ